VFFNTVDRISHKLWKFDDTLDAAKHLDVSEAQARMFEHSVRDAYRYVDFLLGELLNSYGQGPLRVFLVSDHGFQAGPKEGAAHFDMNRLLARMGFRSGDARAFGEARAYAPPDHYLELRAVHLNVKGRDAQGTVPKAEAPALEKKLRAQLAAVLVDGRPLVEIVDAPPGLIDGELPAEIYYRLRAPASVDASVTLFGRAFPYRNLCNLDLLNSGVHHSDGVFIASGQGVAGGKDAALARPLSQLDVLPTMLHALDVPATNSMTGESRSTLLNVPWPLRKRREAAPRARSKPADSRGLSDDAVDELKSLGYVE
jgi:hypothetical protein